MKNFTYQGYIQLNDNTYMVSLRCNDYGYECNYVTEGEIQKVVEEYKEHMDQEHGIDYSKETIVDFINRKKS